MLTQERLKELFSYNEDTGLFIRKVKVKGRFGSVGAIAGSLRKNTGYVSISVDGKLYQAHRLAWVYVYGGFPIGDVDHINRDRKDNRIANLRLATRSQNMQNSYPDASGWYDKATGMYAAAIKVGNKRVWLGRHKTKELARLAYIDAAKKYHKGYACLA